MNRFFRDFTNFIDYFWSISIKKYDAFPNFCSEYSSHLVYDIDISNIHIDGKWGVYKKTLHRLFLLLYKFVNIEREKKGVEDDASKKE